MKRKRENNKFDLEAQKINCKKAKNRLSFVNHILDKMQKLLKDKIDE